MEERDTLIRRGSTALQSVLAAWACALLMLAVAPQAAALPPLNDIVVVGDSITVGAGVSRWRRALVPTLQRRLNRRVHELAAEGASVASFLTPPPGAVNFLGGVFQSTDLVLVLLGTQDYLDDVPVDAFRVAYSALLASIRAPMLFCVSPLWTTFEGLPNGPGHRVADYREAIREACQGTPTQARHYLDGADAIPPSTRYFAGGVFPNDPGYRRLGGYLSDKILQFYPE